MKQLEKNFNAIADNLPDMGPRERQTARIFFFSGAASAVCILNDAAEDPINGIQAVQEFGAELVAFKAEIE